VCFLAESQGAAKSSSLRQHIEQQIGESNANQNDPGEQPYYSPNWEIILSMNKFLTIRTDFWWPHHFVLDTLKLPDGKSIGPSGVNPSKGQGVEVVPKTGFVVKSYLEGKTSDEQVGEGWVMHLGTTITTL